jgi:hypothetical protein
MKGNTPDVLWESGELLIRRSATLGIVNERTKTKRRLRIPLPSALVDILRWQSDALPKGPMRESELLFPSKTGELRASSVLDKPIRDIAEAAKIQKHLTPKLMRRTFQDLSRAAQVHDFVTRAISGHATSAMHEHYSSVAASEVREGLARVISLARFREAHGCAGGDGGGDGTVQGTETPVTHSGVQATGGDASGDEARRQSGDGGGDGRAENQTALPAFVAGSAE